ncbi:MAG: helix-hairpin-helix domain-containing protein [Flavobacteriales bacterium]|nr:helix-hairpin-helix domain-containing protein [Flavobacteriales bacterium]
MVRRALLGALLLQGLAVQAQQDLGVPRDLIEQRIEIAAERLGDDSDVDLTNLFEVLIDRYNDPIDLNSTSADELASLQLLSDVQITAIVDHVRTYGRFTDIYELQTIDQLDAASIRLILPFVEVRTVSGGTRASLKEMLRNGSHELVVRSQITIEQRKGFIGGGDPFNKPYTDPDGDALPNVDDPVVYDSLRANSKVYLGSPWKLYSRYRFRYRQNVSFGITAEKDEGEEFLGRSQPLDTGFLDLGQQPKGFDFYSAHLFVRNVGPVKAVAVGDYLAQFGQGLTFWSGFGFAAKSAYTMNVKRNTPGLSPYTSVNENQFLRGAAVQVEPVKHLELTVFGSRKGLDANVQNPDDPQAENVDQSATISSFQEDGLHRTVNELEKKDAIGETIYGGHLRYRRGTWSVGTTAARSQYDLDLVRNTQPYNQFEFQGSTNTNVGVDWNVMHRNLTWFGEGARSANGGMAGLTGLLIALDRRLSVAMLYRDYQRDYIGLYSLAFAEGTNAWNERGLYTGIEVRPNRVWTINAYFDQFRFPWLRYQTNGPSQGSDWLAQVTWKPSKRVELYGRVRRQDRQRNTEDDVDGVDPLVPVTQVNYRVNASYKVSESVGLRTRVETVDYERGASPLEHGFILYQDIVHRPLKSPVELSGRIALFASDSYDARVYAYENDLIGLFSIPPYYDRGMRWYLMVRATPLRRVDVWVRYGAWIYNGQDRISSGLQEISGNMRSDLKLQVRLRF